jgi:hypothetical protein
MITARKQFDLFENVIPPDTPLGNFQCCHGPPPLPPLPPPPADPLGHYKRFGVTADEHVAALEWLSDNDQTFADLEDRQGELEEIGDTVGAAVVQEQLDRIVADYLESIRRFEPKTSLLDATKVTEATEAPEPVPPAQPPSLKWNQLAQGRKALVSELEKHLREKGWPYMAVDEAKKAIFNASEIDAFDFLVYSTTGPNLLVLVVTRRPTPDQVEQMRQWEQIFGKDFLAAFTFQAAGEWRILSLKELEPPNPLALVQTLDECLIDPKDERNKP